MHFDKKHRSFKKTQRSSDVLAVEKKKIDQLPETDLRNFSICLPFQMFGHLGENLTGFRLSSDGKIFLKDSAATSILGIGPNAKCWETGDTNSNPVAFQV